MNSLKQNIDLCFFNFCKSRTFCCYKYCSKLAFKEWESGHVSTSSPYATCHQKRWINQNMHFFVSLKGLVNPSSFPLHLDGLQEKCFFNSLIHLHNMPPKLHCNSHPPDELLLSSWYKIHPLPTDHATHLNNRNNFIRVWWYQDTIFLSDVLKDTIEGLSL